MAERITCPECRSVLKPAKPVPDGKKVKCPKCGNNFITPGLVEEADRPRKKSAGKAKGKVAVKKTAPKPPDPFDEPNDDGGIYATIQDEEKPEEERPQIEYAPDLSIKDLRGPAQAALVRPSNYLLLVGGLSALANIFMICFSFWPMVFSDSPVDWRKVLDKHYRSQGDEKDRKANLQRIEGIKEYKDLKDKDLEIVQEAEDESRIERFIYIGIYVFLLLYNAICVFGAVKMQNMESRGWGIASSIMTLLPMSAAGLSSLLHLIFFFFLGMLFDEDSMRHLYGGIAGGLFYLLALLVGVWSLRTLMSEEVIAGFEYQAE